MSEVLSSKETLLSSIKDQLQDIILSSPNYEEYKNPKGSGLMGIGAKSSSTLSDFIVNEFFLYDENYLDILVNEGHDQDTLEIGNFTLLGPDNELGLPTRKLFSLGLDKITVVYEVAKETNGPLDEWVALEKNPPRHNLSLTEMSELLFELKEI